MVEFQQPVNYSAANIRELRKRTNMSRREVVERLARHGVSLQQTSLRRIEEGNQAVKIEEAQAFAEIFKVGLEDFITRPIDPVSTMIEEAIDVFREQLKYLNDGLLAAITGVWHLQRELANEGVPPAEQSDTVRRAQRLIDVAVRETSFIEQASALRKEIERLGTPMTVDQVESWNDLLEELGERGSR